MRKLLRTLSILTLLALLISSAALATNLEGTFPYVDISARSISMGGAYTALSEGTLGLQSNPASISSLVGKEIGFMVTDLHGIGIGYSYLGGAVPIKRGAIGLSAIQLVNEIDITYKECSAILSAAYKWSDNLSLGTNIKILKVSSVAPAAGTGIDFGIKFSLNDRVKLGFSAMNLYSSLSFEDYTDSLPQKTQAGLAIVLGGNNVIAIDVNNYKQVCLGFERQLTSFCSVRLGFEESRLSFGLGLNQSKYKIDYAYRNSLVGDSHMLNTVISF